MKVPLLDEARAVETVLRRARQMIVQRALVRGAKMVRKLALVVWERRWVCLISVKASWRVYMLAKAKGEGWAALWGALWALKWVWVWVKG
jgi:hypothetical protein